LASDVVFTTQVPGTQTSLNANLMNLEYNKEYSWTVTAQVQNAGPQNMTNSANWIFTTKKDSGSQPQQPQEPHLELWNQLCASDDNGTIISPSPNTEFQICSKVINAGNATSGAYSIRFEIYDDESNYVESRSVNAPALPAGLGTAICAKVDGGLETGGYLFYAHLIVKMVIVQSNVWSTQIE